MRPAEGRRPPGRWFFLHVPRTGGTSVGQHLRATFAPSEIWPHHEPAPDQIAVHRLLNDVSTLATMTPASRSATRAYRGHFPLSATELLDADVKTMTLLRHPVDRTVSWLQHCRSAHREHAGLRLEAIYDDEWFFRHFVHDTQTRLLSMPREDPSPSAPVSPATSPPGRRFLELIGSTLARDAGLEPHPEVALAALEGIDVVGVTDDHDGFLRTLSDHGWTIGARVRRNASEAAPVPASLRRRILADNQCDLALYQHARSLLGLRSLPT